MYKASSATALLRIGHWSVMLEVSPDAILPRFQRRLHVYRASALPASKLSPCLQVGTTASPQAARMLVGRSIVPDSSEARGTSREAPSDVQQCRMGAGCGRREHFLGWAPTSSRRKSFSHFETPTGKVIIRRGLESAFRRYAGVRVTQTGRREMRSRVRARVHRVSDTLYRYEG